MSSANRGAKRRESDFYPTPPWCVRALLSALPLPGGRWLEAGAGEGAIIRAVAAERRDVQWTAVDVREGCRPFLVSAGAESIAIRNFVEWSTEYTGDRFDATLANPPFSLALEFADRALAVSRHVVFLLRLNWLEGAGRGAWLRRHAPDVYVLPERPSFTGDGATDSIAYAWFHWPSSAERRRGVIEVLDLNHKQLTLIP